MLLWRRAWTTVAVLWYVVAVVARRWQGRLTARHLVAWVHVPSGGRRAAVPGRGSLGARITCSRRQGRLTARPSRCHGYHQEVGVLQLDDKDGSRPVHLAAVGTIRRSVCCSSMTRTAHGPVISLPWVPSGGRCAAAPGRGSLGARITCSRRQGRLTARPSRYWVPSGGRRAAAR